MYEAGMAFRLKPFKHVHIVKNLQVVFGRRKRDWWNPLRHPHGTDESSQFNEFISAIIPTMKFNC